MMMKKSLRKRKKRSHHPMQKANKKQRLRRLKIKQKMRIRSKTKSQPRRAKKVKKVKRQIARTVVSMTRMEERSGAKRVKIGTGSIKRTRMRIKRVCRTTHILRTCSTRIR